MLIRKLAEEQEFIAFSSIVADAYPGFKVETEEQRKKNVENLMKVQRERPNIHIYGIFEGEQILGGMRFHDFTMNLLSTKIKAGGIGLVAVDFLHKKEKIAKNIIEGFINHYLNEGVSMVLLYPFRPDFYKRMGFGFGTSMSQYRVKPANLPKGSSKSNISFKSEAEANQLLECYTRIYEKTNGLIEKYETDFKLLFQNPKNKVVAFTKDNITEGYIIYQFKTDDTNVLNNDIVVNQLIFENTSALSELMTFLNSQADQINHIIFNIQDEDFRFMLDDPRNETNNLLFPVYHECSIQGTGIMYRIINTKGIFEELKGHNFNNQTCKLKISVLDNFVEANHGSYVIHFNEGRATVKDIEGEYEVEIGLDVADFSSLITCAVSFRSLLKYGRVSITNESYINTVNQIFASADKPICLTAF